MNKFLDKSQWYLILFVIVLMALITSPFWLWKVTPEKQLDVLIIDKTVPDESYREHKGLVWILNNEKYLKGNGEPYSMKVDYSGFKPKKDKDYEIRPLPRNLEKYDLLYLADQYGVYEEEFYNSNELGERSNSLYGGLQDEEINKIEQALLHGKEKTLIAEFNTFASPTSKEVRTKISNLLNLDWSGWIGRYFSDLDSKEVPIWVKENYEAAHSKWKFSGAGFVFINKDDYVVVLSEKEVKGEGALFQLKSNPLVDQDISADYQYWFDVINARDRNEVMATYELPITDKAKDKLAGYGIPSEFPAIIHHKNAKYSSYYFAGDFADEAEVPAIYQTKGMAFLKEKFTSNGSFYWKAYVPMMKELFRKGLHQAQEKEEVELANKNGIQFNSKTGDTYVQVMKDGKWQDMLVEGVNMGIAKPGSFPGETAITKEEYFRWFKSIGSMNANTIRVYTLHPPGFYQALYEYNQTAKKPLYLIHGTWLNEEDFVEEQDSFAPKVAEDFQYEIKNMVDIIHGNANIPAKPGHASGEYKYDISRYVLGYMLGIEWDPEAVQGTNKNHKNMAQFTGNYFKTKNATPFEIWLAQMMEFTAEYETGKYKWQHNMTFTNWPTTDLLKHPAEPSINEDLVSVNPNHISKTEQFQAGMFASYHIYPYYPDFMNFEEKYIKFKDSTGKRNNYAGYLNDLKKAHQMPIMVAEFGVPSSRGLTHKNVNDFDQGMHSEQEQGTINKRLFESIVSEGYAGGLVFSWQDEWFKRTWNTMGYDNPDRRPFWNNVQTNEQHFGLLGFEPGEFEPAVYVDGNTADWDKINKKPIYDSDSKESLLKSAYVTSDAGYVYFRLDYNKPLDVKNNSTYLLLDTIANQGQKKLKLEKDLKLNTDFGVDFLTKIKDKNSSELLIDSYYDTFYYDYAHKLKMIPRVKKANQKDNGMFNPIRLALNKELTIPSTNKKVPFQSYETGKLMFGNANPDNQNYNSLTDISVSEDAKTIEVRLAWQLLNVKDPSQREVMGNVWEKGLEGKVETDGIRIAVVAHDSSGNTLTFPVVGNKLIKGQDTFLYSWPKWEEPLYHERLKKSYYMMKETFENVSIEGES